MLETNRNSADKSKCFCIVYELNISKYQFSLVLLHLLILFRMVSDSSKNKKTKSVQEEGDKTNDNEEEEVLLSTKPKKRKIALLSNDGDFVRGKKATKPETKPLNAEPDNIFVSDIWVIDCSVYTVL